MPDDGGSRMWETTRGAAVTPPSAGNEPQVEEERAKLPQFLAARWG